MIQSDFQYTEEVDAQEALLITAEANNESVDVDAFDRVEVCND